MDRGAWQAMVHGVVEESDMTERARARAHTHTHTHTHTVLVKENQTLSPQNMPLWYFDDVELKARGNSRYEKNTLTLLF